MAALAAGGVLAKVLQRWSILTYSCFLNSEAGKQIPRNDQKKGAQKSPAQPVNFFNWADGMPHYTKLYPVPTTEGSFLVNVATKSSVL